MASKEKHLPVLEVESGKIKSTVGSVAHSMTAEHFIEWITLVADNKIEIVDLKPGMEPKAKFIYFTGADETPFIGENDKIVPNCEGTPCNFVCSGKNAKEIEVYLYCNFHGL